MSTKPHQDIKQNSWALRILPDNLRPYAVLARVDRPIGVWLLLIPALWSFSLLARDIPNDALAQYLAYFAIGAFLMRSAGCVINDIWDRNLDKGVERTASRPLASGVLSVKQALLFLAILLGISLIILLQFNTATILLGCLSIPLIIAYPLMKRITWWPQLFLGLTFNFSALVAWSAITESISMQSILLYSAGIFWTLSYDTIYAHQDKEDDIVMGIKSTALRLGSHNKIFVSFCYGAAWTLLLLAAGKEHILSLIPAGIFALYQCKTWMPDDQNSALETFKQSRYFGLLIAFGFFTTHF